MRPPRRGMRLATALALPMLAAGAAGAWAADPELGFVACPVYRDTDSGAKSGCWLATDPATGLRYDISAANTKPDWNRAVLVEGRASQEPATACGAPPLAPVFVSVLEERCTRHMLPAEGFPGHRFSLPPRHLEPIGTAYPPPVPPLGNRTFSVLFGFDRAFLSYQLDDWQVDQAVAYVRTVQPVRVVVTGYEQSAPREVSGHVLAERRGLARERAARIALALRRLGVPGRMIVEQSQVAGTGFATPLADGLAGPGRRRVDIEVQVR